MRWRVVMAVVLVIAGLTLVAPAFADHGVGDRLDCDDFRFQEDAQAHFDAHPGDPDRLDDASFPGVACDDLPFRGGATTPTSALPNILPNTTATSPPTVAPSTTAAPPTPTTTRASSPTTTTAVTPSTTTTTAAASPGTTVAGAGPMPHTGASSGPVLGAASGLVWLGLGLLAASRVTARRRQIGNA